MIGYLEAFLSGGLFFMGAIGVALFLNKGEKDRQWPED